MAKFSNGKIVINKANVNGVIIKTLCVEVERRANKTKEEVLYPLLDENNNYIFESITAARRAGLKKEYIEQEIKRYLADKNNYEKETKEQQSYNSKDLIEIAIASATSLDDLSEIYWQLETRNLLYRYKNKILSKLNVININDPFFYVEFNKYQNNWGDESGSYCFNLYMYKLDLLLQKYSYVKHDEIIDFNGIQVKKEDYLKDLVYNFMKQWQLYNSICVLNDEDYHNFSIIYSRFEHIRYYSVTMILLYISFINCISRINISESVRETILVYEEKVNNKINEISIPSLSFLESYIRALETNSSIDYAKALFQAKTKEDFKKMSILEEKIKNSFFNIEECTLLQACFIKKHRTNRDFEINAVALITLLDNVNLKNIPEFKYLHYLFYDFLFYFTDNYDYRKDSQLIVLSKIKELYNNNYYRYDEEVKQECEYSMKWIMS